MAGTVINTPIDIAKSVKRNVFGSADNIASVSEEGKRWNLNTQLFTL
jgi:hypothetical protein